MPICDLANALYNVDDFDWTESLEKIDILMLLETIGAGGFQEGDFSDPEREHEMKNAIIEHVKFGCMCIL